MDWSVLPADLLHLICKKLSDSSDFVRFRAVCKRWLFAAPLSDPPPQLPWLLEWRDPKRPDSSLLRFYSVSSGKTLTIDVPQASCRRLLGPSQGYILTFDSESYDSRFSLFNPLTKKAIYLPFICKLCSLDYDPCRVFMDPDPTQCDVNGGVLQLSAFKRMLVFCRHFDKEWITVKDDSYRTCGNAYYNGMYFTIENDTMDTKVIDVFTRTVKFTVPPPLIESEVSPARGYTYLVVSGGEILRVFKHSEEKSFMVESSCFDIHRLEFGNGDPCWVRTDDIGDEMLFLEFYHGFSLNAGDFAGFTGNCIYFLRKIVKVGNNYCLCRYDIQKGTTELLPCTVERGGTWFLPSFC